MKLTKTNVQIPFNQAQAGQWVEWEDCGVTCLGIMIEEGGDHPHLYSIFHDGFTELDDDDMVTPVTIEEIKYG